MPALSEFVTTTTQSRLLPKSVDNVLNGNVIAMRLLGQAKQWLGGTSIDIRVLLGNITTVGSYSGFDTLLTTQENIAHRASFTPSQYYVSLPASGIQLAVNQGDAAVINLIASELEWRTKRLKDEMGTDTYLDGTGNSSKALLGLVAAIDDTTNVTTYGGLSRNTYTNWRGTLTAQSGSLSLANLASDFDAAQRGADIPTIHVTTPAVFSIYEALLTPTTTNQFSQNDYRLVNIDNQGGVLVRVGGTVPMAGNGFRGLTFRGIPFVADEKCTSGNIFTLNENHLSFYTIPQNTSILNRSEVGGGFYRSQWKEPANQDGTVLEMFWYGQLIADAPRTMARRTGVTS